MQEEQRFLTVAEAQREGLSLDGTVEIRPTDVQYPMGRMTPAAVEEIRNSAVRLTAWKLSDVHIDSPAPPWNGMDRFSLINAEIRETQAQEKLGILIEDGCLLSPQESAVLCRWQAEIEVIRARCDKLMGLLKFQPAWRQHRMGSRVTHELREVDYDSIVNLEADVQRTFGHVRARIFGAIVSGDSNLRQEIDIRAMMQNVEAIAAKMHVRIDYLRERMRR